MMGFLKYLLAGLCVLAVGATAGAVSAAAFILTFPYSVMVCIPAVLLGIAWLIGSQVRARAR